MTDAVAYVILAGEEVMLLMEGKMRVIGRAGIQGGIRAGGLGSERGQKM